MKCYKSDNGLFMFCQNLILYIQTIIYNWEDIYFHIVESEEYDVYTNPQDEKDKLHGTNSSTNKSSPLRSIGTVNDYKEAVESRGNENANLRSKKTQYSTTQGGIQGKTTNTKKLMNKNSGQLSGRMTHKGIPEIIWQFTKDDKNKISFLLYVLI